jgi:autotransporter-associated beta strand protein
LITRAANSTLHLGLTGTQSATNNINVGTTTLANWATVNLNGNYNFAAKNGSNNLIAVTTTDRSTLAFGGVVTENATDTTGYTGTYTNTAGTVAANNVRFDFAGTSSLAVNAGSILNLTGGASIGGGILVTPTVAANAASISGGVLTSSGGELIVHQHNTGSDFTISSRIENAGSLPTVVVNLTKTGLGTLLLSGTGSNYTGGTNINEGTLKVSGGSAIGDRSTVTLANKLNAILDLNGSNEAIGSLAGGGYLGGGTPVPGSGFAAANSGAATVGGTVAIGSNTLTINQGGNTTYAGQITGNGALIVQGLLPGTNGNTLTLQSATNSFTGTLTINNAQVAVNNGTGLATGNAVGNLTNVGAITISNGGGLSIDNAGSLLANRINDLAAITLVNTAPSATVTTVGLSTNTDQASVFAESLRNERVGAVTLAGGNNTLRSSATAALTNPVLTLASLTRTNSSTLVVIGSGLDNPLSTQRGDVVVADPTAGTNLITGLIGGGSTISGSSNISILPWAIGSNSAATGQIGNSFVTYSTFGGFGGFGNGFRSLNLTTDYEQLVAAGGVTATNNVRYSGAIDLTLTGTAHSVNSLLVDNTSTTALVRLLGSGAGDSLNLASGAALFTGTLPIQISGFDNGITSGATGEYIFHQNNTSAGGVTISSNLTSTGGITKSGPGILKLTGANSSLTGPIIVNQGTLGINSAAAINNLGVTLAGGSLGLTLDGDGTASNEVLVGPSFAITMMAGVDSGITVDRLGNGTSAGPLLFQTASNKTIQSSGTITGLTNQTLTITNSSGYGLDLTAAYALPTASTPTFNVLNATNSNVVQGFTLSGALTGGVAGGTAFIKTGLGTLALTNGAGNTFGSGGSTIDIQNGVLSVPNVASLGDSSNIVLLNPGAGLVATFRATGNMTLDAATTPALKFGALDSASARRIEVANGATLTLASAIDASLAPGAPLQKNDLGTLSITVAQPSFTGTTTINQGVIQISNNTALGSGQIILNGVAGAALHLSGGITLANAVNAASTTGGGNGINNTGAIFSASGVNTVTGAITNSAVQGQTYGAANGATLNIASGAMQNSNSPTFNTVGTGIINLGSYTPNTAAFTKIGAGTLNLTGVASSTATPIIAQGTFNISGAGQLTGATGNITVNNNALLNIDDRGTAVTRIAGARTVGLANGNLSYTANGFAVSTQTFGALTSSWGANTITLNNEDASNATLTFASVGAAAGGSVLTLASAQTFNATTNRLVFTTLPTMTNGIMQRVVVKDGAGTNFATNTGAATPTTAFTAYTVTDGTGDVVGPDTDLTFTNVNGGTAYGINASNVTGVFSAITNYNVTGDTVALSNPGLNGRTLNSLRIAGAGTDVTFATSGGQQLILTSGNILSVAANQTIGNAALVATNSAPVIAFGAVEGGLLVDSGADLTVNAAITSSANVTKGLGGNLTFATKQFFNTGAAVFTINGGTVTLAGGENTLWQGAQGGTNGQLLSVGPGATLNLNGTAQMTGDLTSPNRTAFAGTGGTITSSTAATLVAVHANGTANQWGGQITDNVFFNKSGATTNTFYSDNTYTGGTLINGGTLTLLDEGKLSGTSAIKLAYSTLSISNTGTTDLTNRVNDSAAISLLGGTLTFLGRAQANSTETLGAVTLVQGNSIITVTEGGTGVRSAELTLTSLNRAAGGGTVNFSPTGLGLIGSAGRLLIPTLNGVATSALGAGLTNNIIGGWAIINTSDFASYNPTLGVGRLDSVGFAGYSNPTTTTGTLDAAAASDNINLNAAVTGSITVTNDLTINSLRFGNVAANTVDIAAGKTLTLSSGGLLFFSTATQTLGSVVNQGSLTTTGPELFVYTQGTGPQVINSAITGAGVTLVKSGGNALTLAGTNTYGGGTVLNQGTTTLAATGTLPGNGLTVNGATFTQVAGGIITPQVVTLNGSATVNLAAATTNSLTGLVFNNNGGTAPTLAIGTGILTLTGNITAASENAGSVAVISGTGSGGVAVDIGAVTRDITASAVTINGNSTVANITPTLNISAPIGGTGGLNLNGTGLVQLGGASLFTGGVTLATGGLAIGGNTNVTTRDSITGIANTFANGPVGTNPLTINSGTYLTVDTGTRTLNNDYVLGGLNLTLKGTNSLTLNGATSLNAGNTVITVDAPQAILTLNGAITGGATDYITKEGLGTLVLGSGLNNWGAAATTSAIVNAGTLTLAGLNGASTAPVFAGSNVLINDGGLLSLQNSGTGSNGLISYANNITINASNSTANIHVGNNGANTLNTIEVADLSLLGGQILNVSSANGYILRLLNVSGDTPTGLVPQINVASGATVVVFGYSGDKPINVGQGSLVFPDLVTIGQTNTLAGGDVTLSGSYPLGIQNQVLTGANMTDFGYSSGGLNAAFANLTTAPATSVISQQVAGIGFSGSNFVANRLNDGVLGNRPNVLTGTAVNSAAVYSGFLEITTGGDYTFRTGGDDGFALFIDGNAIITGFPGGMTDSAAVTVTGLSAGYHSIVYKSSNAGSGGAFRLLYAGADTGGATSFQSIDSSKLYNTTAAPTVANFFNGAAIINQNYSLAASTSATIDTFGTQFGAVIDSSKTLTLGADSRLNIVNGPNGSFGTGWYGAGGATSITGTGALVYTGNTATASAGTLNLIGAVTDSGNGLTKSGTGTLILGANNTATFTGVLTVQGGTVILNNANALPAGGITIRNNSANSTTLPTNTTGNTLITLAGADTNANMGIQVGSAVFGTGIPVGAYVTGTPTGTTFTISVPTTAALAGVYNFSASGMLDLNGQSAVAGNINITGAGATLPSATPANILNANSGAALWNSSGTAASLAGSLTLGGNASVGGYGDLTLGVINSLATTQTLTKTGTNTLFLNTDNSTTLLGPISVSAATTSAGGIIKLGVAGALGAATSLAQDGTTLASGAVLDLNGQTTSEFLSIAGSGRGNFTAARNTLGALVNSNTTTTATVNSALVLSAAASIGSDWINATSGGSAGSDITLGGIVSGAFTLTKVGSNKLTLTAANTFSAATLALGDITVSGAAGQLGIAGTVTINAGPVSAGIPTNTLLLDNSGTAVSGRLSVLNTANRAVTVNGGELIINSGAATVNENIGTGILTFGGGFSVVTLDNTTSQNVRLTSTGAATLARAANTATVLIRGTSLGSGTPATTNTNVIIGTAPTPVGSTSEAFGATTATGILPWLIVDQSASGSGTSFANYTATAGIQPLAAGNYAATLPTGAVANSATDLNIRLAAAASLANATPNSFQTTGINSLTFNTASKNITLADKVNLSLDSGGILALEDNTIGVGGTGFLNVGGNREAIVHVIGSTKTLTVAVPFGGTVAPTTGGLTKSGNGTLILGSSSGNNYTGQTTVNGGTLQIAAGAPDNAIFYRAATAPAINALTTTSNANALVVNAGATLDLTSNSQIVGNLSSAGTLPGTGGIVTGTGNLVVNQSNSQTWAGSIQGVGLNFTRTGAATTLTFTDDNTYTGTTTVRAGVLALVDQASSPARLASRLPTRFSVGTTLVSSPWLTASVLSRSRSTVGHLNTSAAAAPTDRSPWQSECHRRHWPHPLGCGQQHLRHRDTQPRRHLQPCHGFHSQLHLPHRIVRRQPVCQRHCERAEYERQWHPRRLGYSGNLGWQHR